MADSNTTRIKRSLQDFTGRIFGLLEVLERYESASNRKHWKCQCTACGELKIVRSDHLSDRRYASCLCMNRSQNGLSKTREGRIWQKMIDRCYRDTNDNFRFYGGCGHYVCERWLDSIANFVEDVGVSPSRLHTLDRINTHGSYTCGHCEECRKKNQPANCRWATKSEQMHNMKNNLWFTHDGETLILKDWARKTGIRYLTLWQRLYVSNWAFEKAISAPTIKSGANRKR